MPRNISGDADSGTNPWYTAFHKQPIHGPVRIGTLAVSGDGQADLSPMVLKARDSVLAIDAKVEAEYGIPQETFRNAEYGKSILGGVDPVEALRHAQAAGFRSAEVHFDWFLGQAETMHGDSFAAADKIETYLHGVAPDANHLFKYLRLELTK